MLSGIVWGFLFPCLHLYSKMEPILNWNIMPSYKNKTPFQRIGVNVVLFIHKVRKPAISAYIPNSTNIWCNIIAGYDFITKLVAKKHITIELISSILLASISLTHVHTHIRFCIFKKQQLCFIKKDCTILKNVNWKSNRHQ